jgi:hypothetical protein
MRETKYRKKFPKLATLLDDLANDADHFLGPAGGRGGICDYLERVFVVYLRWRKRKKLKERARQIRMLRELPKIGSGAGPLCVLIAGTSGLNPKNRSRYAYLLRDAAKAAVSPAGLKSFIRQKRAAEGRRRVQQPGGGVQKPGDWD